MLKGVIFDFDGTLVFHDMDFKKIRETIIKKALQYRLHIPRKNFHILELINYIEIHNKKNTLSKKFLADARRYLKNCEIESAGKSYPVPGGINFIKALKRKGIKTGIITRNCRDAVEMVINRFDIPYDVLLTRNDTEKVKPDKMHIKTAIKLLGLQKNEVIMVGDHPMDISCAKKSKVLSCGILSENTSYKLFEKAGADFIFENIKDVGYLLGIKHIMPGKLPNPLLNHLLKRYVTTKNDSVIVGPGIGIDCAVFKNPGNIIFAKTDPVTLTGQDTGLYIVNINVNDLAVMGGKPKWFLCDLLFPDKTTFQEIEDVFYQIFRGCKNYDVDWLGGHTEISRGVKTTIACGTVLGNPLKNVVKRKAPAEGDKIFLVKEVGIEAASLIVREKRQHLQKKFSQRFIRKVLNAVYKPGISVFNECNLLWKNFDVKILHDPTEGGLSTALYEIADIYNAGFVVNDRDIIFFPPLLKLTKMFNLNPYGIISSGCLIGIASGEESRRIKDFMERRKIKCSIIGEVTKKEKGVFLRKSGNLSRFPVFERDEITRL
jgi:hydrogenase expression/formation protein HypE